MLHLLHYGDHFDVFLPSALSAQDDDIQGEAAGNQRQPQLIDLTHQIEDSPAGKKRQSQLIDLTQTPPKKKTRQAWNCELCTLKNDGYRKQCDMCGAPRL